MFPSYIIGISSNGPDNFYTGYDYVAASKSLLELFAKYLSVHLFNEGTKVNIIRFGIVPTDSFDHFFGTGFFEHLKKNNIPDDIIMQPKECGKALLALCSGLLD